jgi:D-alanyl-D-alanine carboxypeptidase
VKAVRQSSARLPVAFTALVCLALTQRAAPAAVQSAPAWSADVDAAVTEWLAHTRAPSASIAIVAQGQIALVRTYGFARLTPPVIATPSSRYAIDSVSKEFTAAAVLLLSQAGKLSLDDPVRKWYPNIGAAANVTLRQLLTHTSGIRDFWPQDFVTPEMMHSTTTAAIIKEWVQRPLDFTPGTQWQYSNSGYVLAAAIVEKVSGEKLFPFLERHIFAPLGMMRVADYDAGPLTEHGASGYTRYGLAPPHPAPREGDGWLFGAAELAMAPSYLARWDLSLINRSFLSPSSYATAFERVRLADGTRRDYGLGLDIEQRDGRLRIGHGGAGSGFLAANRIWPDEKIAIVVLTNNDWASPDDLVDRLAFLVLPPTPEELRARNVFAGFQQGRVDRSAFTAVGNSYLTAAVLADLKASLGPLGAARLIALSHESKRGGMVTRVWKILCRDARLEVIERGYPDGKLDEFIVGARLD